MPIPKLKKKRGPNKPKIFAEPVFKFASVEPVDNNNFNVGDTQDLGEFVNNPMRTMNNDKIAQKLMENPFIKNDIGLTPKKKEITPKKTPEELRAIKIENLKKAWDKRRNKEIK
jgi:hypothetical protein